MSISGLHMVLAAGTLFWLVRALLACSARAALSWPIKKIAALAGMAGATAYCVFSGSDVATERALFMILVMQGAILVDRPALSLRNLALSALVVLAREPEALLGPSFQMSYGAVAGLIAFAEWQRGRRPPAEPGDPLRRAGRAIVAVALGTLLTTAIATAATGPFATFHFQAWQPYGLIGNAATLPLVSFAVMPAALAGVLAYPFGLDRPVWSLMGHAVSAVLALSEWVAGFPGASQVVPAFGAGTLLLLVAALLLVTLPGPALRPLALVPGLAAAAALAASSRPDVYVARDGSGAAIRTRDGSLAVVGRVSAFTVEQWLRADGDGRRADDPGLRAAARCDGLGCTVPLRGGGTAAYLTDRRGAAADCARAALVIARVTLPPGCAAATVVDRAFLALHGAAAFRLDEKGIGREGKDGEGAASAGLVPAGSVRSPGLARPWLVPPRPPAEAPTASPPRSPGTPVPGRRTEEVGPGNPAGADEDGPGPGRDDGEP